MKELFDNDKIIAIACATVICLVSVVVLGAEAKDLILPAITGIFGVVTGAAMK